MATFTLGVLAVWFLVFVLIANLATLCFACGEKSTTGFDPAFSQKCTWPAEDAASRNGESKVAPAQHRNLA